MGILNMSFTTAKVIKILDRGILIKDGYDVEKRVLWDDVAIEDRDSIQEQSKVVVHEDGLVELVTASFIRWRESIYTQELELSNENTFVLEDE